ncbi:MAG: TetR family transcriptional regulator [Rhizobiales bacterium]|nr:TetR family transcriptional regulator [Hyphomicrobiales bacterium]
MSQSAEQKWQRRKEERPAEIMEAALTLFSEKGFAATRLEDVAEAAGVSKATIYLYFDSKIDLLLANVQEIALSRFDEIETMLSLYDGKIADLPTLLLGRVSEIARTTKMPDLARVVMSEAHNFPEIADFYRDNVVKRGLGIIAGIIARGIESGEFRKCDPAATAQSVMFPIIMNVIGRKTFGEIPELDPMKFFPSHIDFVLRGLAADKEA